MLRYALVTALLIACGSAPTPAPQANVVTARQPLVPAAPTQAPPATATAQGPGDVSAISALLGARHAQDLPDKAALDAHVDADTTIAWLAQHGDSAHLRARATTALGHYPNAGHDTLVGSYASADSPHPKLRMAALHALADWPLTARSPHAAVIEQSMKESDPRVATAAVKAATGVPALHDALTAAQQHALPEVQQAASAALRAP